MENTANLNIINQTTYTRNDVVRFYLAVDDLQPAERVLFERLDAQIRGKRVLDIGVGGGRTTGHLVKLTEDYTGVDYVRKYVEETSKKFRSAKIVCSDARDLADFADESFDFVLFSYNGLDSVSHEARLRVLSAVNRVLAPGGIFMFSSHNRDYEHFNKLPWQRTIVFSRAYLIFMLHCLYHWPKHLKMKKHEVHADEYAILNDGDHRFSLLLYYISIAKQKHQLEKAGFRDIEAFDQQGNMVEVDAESHWIHYLARKPGGIDTVDKGR